MKTLITDPLILELIDPNCSSHRLHDLRYHPFFLVRALVALHENTFNDTLLQMKGDPDESVLSAVASKIKGFWWMVERDFATHESEVVRCGAAMNPEISGAVLQMLEELDESRMVQEAAARNRKAREEKLKITKPP